MGNITLALNAEFCTESHMHINTQCWQWNACPCQSFRQLSWKRMPTHPCIYSNETITLNRSGLHWRIQTMLCKLAIPAPPFSMHPRTQVRTLDTVNPGGLIEAIRKMVEVSSKVFIFFPAPDWKVVRRRQKHIVMLSTSAAGSIGLVVESYSRTWFWQTNHKDYSIERYWVHYFADKVAE